MDRAAAIEDQGRATDLVRNPRFLTGLLFYWLTPAMMAVFVWKTLPLPAAVWLSLTFVLATAWSLCMQIRRAPETGRRRTFYCWVLLAALGTGTVTQALLYLRGPRTALWYLPGVRTRLSDLRRLDLFRADVSGQDLRGRHLVGANLDEANLSEANLSGANLRGASLRGASLRGARLRGADLSGADLNRADLSGADLRWAFGLAQEQVDKTLGDEDTKLPEGLMRPDHWK